MSFFVLPRRCQWIWHFFPLRWSYLFLLFSGLLTLTLFLFIYFLIFFSFFIVFFFFFFFFFSSSISFSFLLIVFSFSWSSSSSSISLSSQKLFSGLDAGSVTSYCLSPSTIFSSFSSSAMVAIFPGSSQLYTLPLDCFLCWLQILRKSCQLFV